MGRARTAPGQDYNGHVPWSRTLVTYPGHVPWSRTLVTGASALAPDASDEPAELTDDSDVPGGAPRRLSHAMVRTHPRAQVGMYTVAPPRAKRGGHLPAPCRLFPCAGTPCLASQPASCAPALPSFCAGAALRSSAQAPPPPKLIGSVTVTW